MGGGCIESPPSFLSLSQNALPFLSSGEHRREEEGVALQGRPTDNAKAKQMHGGGRRIDRHVEYKCYVNNSENFERKRVKLAKRRSQKRVCIGIS